MAEPLMKLLDQEEEIEELQGRDGKVLTFVAEEGNEQPESFGLELEEDRPLPRPGPEVFDELAIPQANTDEDFEEFDGAEIPAGLLAHFTKSGRVVARQSVMGDSSTIRTSWNCC